jgi:hypothetical protein
MTPKRRTQAEKIRFHELDRTSAELKEVFDIDIFAGMTKDDISFAIQRFLRRNIYEHKAGVVDQEYLDRSNDNKIAGQKIEERPGNVRNLVEIILKMAANLDDGFLSIVPVDNAHPVFDTGIFKIVP